MKIFTSKFIFLYTADLLINYPDLLFRLREYHGTYAAGIGMLDLAKKASTQFKKPIMNTETGCYSLATPYDQAIKLHNSYGFGYTLWELMVSDCEDCADKRRQRITFLNFYKQFA